MVLGHHYHGMMTIYNLRNHPSDNMLEAGNRYEIYGTKGT